MNRLATETSPYLRQHADNPVDWWPWGDGAFNEAVRRDVPVLLSIGYSACHWCHVMARESFENPTIAAQMNAQFVSIKVDREERPDVDAVYMDATQAMTGHGGWPMTVALDHQRRPFFAGTYFPPTSAQGRIGFPELLDRITEAWTTRRAEIEEHSAEITDYLTQAAALPQSPAGDSVPVNEALVETGVAALARSFDRLHGGFGPAPKFPVPSRLTLLLHRQARHPTPEVGHMIATTLDGMASGGIYDHIGGGFARYATEVTWLIPHFEKMLYDQAGLLRAYTQGWQMAVADADAEADSGAESRRADQWKQVVEETVGYVLRDLAQPGGGISAAEDADSMPADGAPPTEPTHSPGHGVEGLFTTWTIDEMRAVLADDADPAIDWYQAKPHGNFERRNILHRPLGATLLRPARVEEARQKLFAARQQRPRPGLDDKVLADWNAMWVSALATAGAAFARPDWVQSAAHTATFLIDHLRNPSGRWKRSWQRTGGARHLALGGDYAWLVDAFTRLYEATGQASWLDEAIGTAHQLRERFIDPDDGCVYTTGNDGEPLLVRAKDTHDSATPSTNSVAAVALLRLGAITGDQEWSTAGQRIVTALAPAMAQAPQAFTNGLVATALVVNGITEVVITGHRPDLVATAQRAFRPDQVLVWGDRTNSPLWEGRHETGAGGRAYVCHQQVCEAPVMTPDALAAALRTP